MFQEQSKFHELSSSVEKDFSSKKDYNLSAYTRVRLTDAIVQVYRFSKPSLDNIKINKDTKGYIWLDDKEVVGYINVEERDDDYKWIQSFEIYEPYKGHGLSKQMLKIAITELGATNLTVSKDNDLAIKVYKSFGFKTYKSTDSSYHMSRDKNIEEAYYSKDSFTNAQFKSSLNDSDFRDTAAFAQKQLVKLHSAGQYNFITCTDIGFSEGELSYAEYEIENDYQIEQLRKLINILNKTVSTSKYCGTFLFPQQISVGAVGSLKLKLDDRYVSENTDAVSNDEVDSFKVNALKAFCVFIPILLLICGTMVPALSELSVGHAMIIGCAIAALVTKTGPKQIMKEFWKGAGSGFTGTFSIVVCATVFVTGMTTIGLIDAMTDLFINSPSIAKISASVGPALMAIITGTGTGMAVAFNQAVSANAEAFGMLPINMGGLVTLGSCMARALSPVAGVVILTSGIAGCTPGEAIKKQIPSFVIAMIAGAAMFLLK